MTQGPRFIVSAGDLPERTHVYPQSSAPQALGPHDGLPDALHDKLAGERR